jgi:HTH-type transcriptional regulator/antitoxin HigA
MNAEVIKTKADYELALAEFCRLIDIPEALWDLDRLDALAARIKQYEDIHYPIDPPDPIDAIKFRMEQAGLTEEDLVPCIGSQTMAKEVLAGIRPLTLDMAKALEKAFGIPLDVLIPEGIQE